MEVEHDGRTDKKTAYVDRNYGFLKGILHAAKSGYRYCIETDCLRLDGALAYMCFVGDISQEDSDRIHRLVKTIKKKYKIF